MEKYLSVLNERQLEAVTTDSQYVRIIAGAGSGKTRVLTTRIMYIIENWGIDPRKILAITFTNKAAHEMRDRIIESLPDQAGQVRLSTIHSFCVLVLRMEIKHLNYPTNFTILDAEDQKSIIKEAFKALNIDSKKHTTAGILDYIGNMKYAGIDYEGAKRLSYNYFEKQKAEIYNYYLNRQHELYALDFDDLVLWTIDLFKKFTEVRAKWQKRYQFILVDEFQDIDNAQYELISLLANENTYIYVVGDPDQTIYTWRGANINIIMNFERDFSPCKTIILERNYRSTQTILNAANSLIQYNKNRVEKELYTSNEEGKKIVYCKAPTEDDEAIYVANKILELCREIENDYEDCAILYRSNYQSRSFEKALINLKIPYVIYGGIGFYERKEVKDILSYLRMITTNDDLAFKRVINVPKRGVGTKTVDSLLEEARARGISMYEVAKEGNYSQRVHNCIDDFIGMIERWKGIYREKHLEEVFQMVFEESGYRAMLETSDDPKDEERLENVKELLNDIQGFLNGNPEGGLEEYLQMVALYTDIQTDRDSKRVPLMTVHSSKGLEFNNVFVVGLTDGVFPSEKSMQEGLKGLEEERRLAYVAFTRAKKRLFLTESMGYNYVASTAKSTSRFIGEVDKQYIERVGVRTDERTVGISTDRVMMEKMPGSRRKTGLKPGDLVIHDDFGEGVVLSVNGNFGDIAFGYPFLTKTMSLTFPKLHKKEGKKDE